MRSIKIGEKTYGVRATTLALLFYKQEFHRPLLTDYVNGAKEAESNGGMYDEILLLQIMWAMHKADRLPEKTPSFIDWISEIEGFNFSDPEIYQSILGEAGEGFFQKPLIKGQPQIKKPRKRT